MWSMEASYYKNSKFNATNLVTPLHQFHGHLRIQNLIMQMIFHLEMNWWTDIGTAHTNFGNNQNASHGEAHRAPNQIAL